MRTLRDPGAPPRTDFSRLAALASVCAIPLLAACFDVWGTYETGSAASGAGGSDVDVATGGAPTTIGGGGASVERCDDGLDDDDDGLVDCADASDCAGYVCSTSPTDDPAWLGPVLLRDADDARACPPSFPTAGPDLRSVSTPCTCACGAPTGESCRAKVTAHAASACGGTTTSATADSLACVPLAATATTASATGEARGGTCAASVSGGPDPGTDPVRKTCEGTAGGGCADGDICLRPPGAADGQLCWYQVGDVACPPSLPSRTILYDAAMAPACAGTACTCGASANGTCAGTVTLYDTDCTSANTASIPLTGACTAGLGTSGSIKIGTASVSAAGTCAPAAAFPVGALDGSARTYCCAP